MSKEFRVLRPFEFHCQLISNGTRADGRELTEFRNIKLETEGIRTADSSSLVKLGNTSLVCGCTSQLYPSHAKDQHSNDEVINITVELPPICSSPTGYRTQHTAQLLTKVLKNILDDTDCLDKLCLFFSDQDCHWSIDVEVICLNYDGCLLDAALIAVIAALKTLKLKDATNHAPERSFVINSIPVCSSFAIIGDHLICDPNLEEETIAQSTFSITVDPSFDNGKYHINKVGGKAINTKRLDECVTLARQRAQQIVAYLNEIGLRSDSSKMDCT